MKLEIHRITSYNVCYTKLLRIGQTNDRRIEITSEQFKMYKATDTDIIFYLTGIDK